MEASPAPASRISVGEVVSETFRVYRENAGALLGSAVAVFIIVGVLAALLEATDAVIFILLASVVRIAGDTLYMGFVVELVHDVRDGRRDHAVGDLFSAAAPVILPLIAFAILYAIGVMVGLILLIVPGLILLTFWSVGAPAMVVERIGPIAAFRRSWRLVSGDAWSVFGVVFVTALIVLGIGLLLAAIATPIGDGEIATYVASIVASAITAPVFALAASIMYFDLGGGSVAAPPPITAPAEDRPSSVD